MPTSPHSTDVAIIGAGAAGLMCAIWARRTNANCKVTLLESAPRIGAKILIAGGGRCNVTHYEVDASAFAGSTQPAIRKILKRFDVPETIAFFKELGVELKRESTGKLFPVTDRAQTVLNALLHAANKMDVQILTSHRVEAIDRRSAGFLVGTVRGKLECSRLVIATGGKSVPKTGSDGHGFTMAQTMGHTLTDHIFPGLVPLLLPQDHFLKSLSGVSANVQLTLRSTSGKHIKQFTGSLLCTHFGISGPVVLDISRYYIGHTIMNPNVAIYVNWIPNFSKEQIENELIGLRSRTIQNWLRDKIAERLARALIEHISIDPTTSGYRLTKASRKHLVQTLTDLKLPITGNRGFGYAEVTAGGVPLKELNLKTMESRCCPGLYLCGEICDVDGRIGGFNFQWAWASGYVAGVSVAS